MGIDYGMGKTNIDLKTGIRFGVISQHSVSGEALNDMELDYGSPMCPKCGNEVTAIGDDSVVGLDLDGDGWTHAPHDCKDFVCIDCKYVFGTESAFGDDPIGGYYDQDGYRIIDCLDNDWMVTLSPYWTRAPFCSPCVPGAGNLDGAAMDVPAIPTQPKTYCLGHDWFADGVAPYPVYKVSDNSLVIP
jgi:hypothetical protein